MNDVFKLENVVEGMKIITKGKLECDTCVQGKMSQYRNREPDRGATSLLQLVHGNLAGPITPESKDGHKYAMVFVDDYSGALGIYSLKNKSDAVRATEQSDNGGEYISQKFKSLLLKTMLSMNFQLPTHPIKMEQLKEPGDQFLIWLDAY